jgi:AcrR family transcriptional regulator
MSPRHRTIHNDTIIRLACDLLIERGPAAITFAQVAQRAGLAPATLVQRFATRDAMLAALATGLTAIVIPAFDRPGTSPLGRLRAGSAQLAPAIAAALALSPDTGTGQFILTIRKQVSFALSAAIEGGELPRCDIAQLGRTIQIAIVGAVASARLEGGDVQSEVLQAVDQQLAAYV